MCPVSSILETKCPDPAYTGCIITVSIINDWRFVRHADIDWKDSVVGRIRRINLGVETVHPGHGKPFPLGRLLT